jgi:hypothetical protein
MIIRIDVDRFVDVDDDKIQSLSELRNRTKELSDGMPIQQTTDKQLLAWAKMNYSLSNEKQIIDSNTKIIADIEKIVSLVEKQSIAEVKDAS